MFQKLNIRLEDIDFKKLKYSKPRKYVEGADILSGRFDEHNIRMQQNALLEVIKEIVVFQLPPDDINITVIESGGAIAPHTDVCCTALNYYVHAEKEVTTFYNNLTGHKWPASTPGLHGYDIDQLAPVCSFVAVTNDCYLINTHVPHTVSFSYANSTRTLLRFVWNHANFEQVLSSIQLK